MTNEKVELFSEILASDQLGPYQNFSSMLMGVIPTADPSWVWSQLSCNPWIAMAIYWEMEEKDAAIFSALDTRKTNVLSKTWNLFPASEKRQDRKIADFVEECLKVHFEDFDSFLYEALDAIGKGVSIGEKIFAAAGDRICISDVRFKPQHLFTFGETGIANYSTASIAYPQTGPLQLRTGVSVGNIALGGVLPEEKFFVFSFRTRYGNRWGDPVDRKAFWPSWIKRNSIKQWLRYQEKGSGVVVAKYPGSSGPKEQGDALAAAAAVQDETAVAIPDKFVLEVHEMVRNIGSSHKELVDDFCNAEISRIYLGQTLTSRGSDGGGSRALGEVHERKEDRIGEADCRSLMQAINSQIVRPLVQLNFGLSTPCPQFRFDYEPKEDLDAKAKRYAVIRKDIGLELSKTQVRDDLQLEEPTDEGDTLQASTKADDRGLADNADPSETTEFAEGDDLKKNAKNVRDAIDLEDATLRTLAPIYAGMLEKAIHVVELAELLNVKPDLDKLLSADFQTLADRLATGALAACLLGRYRVKTIAANFAEGGDDKDKKRPSKRRSWRQETYGPNEKHETADELIRPNNSVLTGLRFDVPPEKAIEFFKGKKIVSPDEFYKLDAAARSGAFAIANVYQTDVLEAFRDEITAALENGRGPASVAARLRSILDGQTGIRKELTDFHLETVARTMMGISYAVGQRQAMEDVADLLPIWRYSAVGDDRTRPSHMALDGLEYPANHPFWQLHYPPWEFNCRCDVIPLPAASSSRIRRDAPRATLDFDDDGLPIRAAVDGTVTSISPGRLSGAVAQSPTLDDVLKASADRARTSRQRALD